MGITPNLGLLLSGHGADTHNDGTSAFDLDTNMQIIDEAVGSGGGTNIVTKTADYTAKAGDVVLCDTSAGGFTVTIPLSASNKSKAITVKKKSADSNVLTIAASGSDSLDTFGATITTNQPGTALDFLGDGTATWELI